jgi:predicted nucleic acid-binding protein
MKFLDTSFLIDILRSVPPAVALLDELETDDPHMTSSINLNEFLVGAYGSRNVKDELRARKKLINKLVVVPFDNVSAEESAIIENNLRSAGELIGTADILIAGIMKRNGIKEIITRNTKHFEKIEGIQARGY